MAQRHPESLETQNRRLRSMHKEMSEDLTEQREMVKHLHNVIKSYENLVRKPGDTAVQKHSINRRPRHGQGGSPEEDVFVRKVLESVQPNSNSGARTTSKKRNISCPALIQRSRKVLTTQTEQHETKEPPGNAAESASSTLGEQRMCSAKTETATNNLIGGKRTTSMRKFPLGGRLDSSSDGKQQSSGCTKRELSATRDFSWSYKPRHEMISHMNCFLDSMLQKVEHHKQSLKIKERHVARAERRLEYLQSIALGQESEWL